MWAPEGAVLRRSRIGLFCASMGGGDWISYARESVVLCPGVLQQGARYCPPRSRVAPGRFEWSREAAVLATVANRRFALRAKRGRRDFRLESAVVFGGAKRRFTLARWVLATGIIPPLRGHTEYIIILNY